MNSCVGGKKGVAEKYAFQSFLFIRVITLICVKKSLKAVNLQLISAAVHWTIRHSNYNEWSPLLSQIVAVGAVEEQLLLSLFPLILPTLWWWQLVIVEGLHWEEQRRKIPHTPNAK